MTCPDNIDLLIKLTINHCQHCNISFLAFHLLMREKTSRDHCVWHGAGRCWAPCVAEAPSFVGSGDPCTHSRGSQKLYGSTKPHWKENYWFRELPQGIPHQLCCILKRCWIMRWRITHVILFATHLSRIVSISYLLFLFTANLSMIEILRAGLCQVGIF